MIRLRRLKHIKVFLKKVILTVGHIHNHIVALRQSRPVAWDVVCPVKCRVLNVIVETYVGVTNILC